MARVLILTLHFAPEGVSTGRLVGEIATGLQEAGHQVDVLTSTPHTNRDEAAEREQPINRRRFGPVGRSDYHGIPVRHIVMPAKPAGRLRRILHWAWFHVAATAVAWRLPRPDVIFTVSPPLTNGVTAWSIGRFGRIPYLYNVWEMFPDFPIRLGYVSNRRLQRLLLWLERFVYRRAAAVSAVSQAMGDMLGDRKAVPAEKLYVVPNFVDPDQIGPVGKDNPFGRAHGLVDRFVVCYAGNMGPPQRLETLVESARLLRHRPDIHFLLVGGGTERERLAAIAGELGLDNLTVLPHQSSESVPDIYGSSDLCLVPLSKELTAEVMPSKVYQIMAARRPVLVAADARSGIARVVEAAGGGIVVPPESSDELAAAIEHAADDQAGLDQMAERGRAHVLGHYQRAHAVGGYLDMIQAVVTDGSG